MTVRGGECTAVQIGSILRPAASRRPGWSKKRPPALIVIRIYDPGRDLDVGKIVYCPIRLRLPHFGHLGEKGRKVTHLWFNEQSTVGDVLSHEEGILALDRFCRTPSSSMRMCCTSSYI